MPIRASCSHCSAVFNLADTMRGKRVRCRECSEIFTVKAPDQEDKATEAEEDDSPRRGIATEPRRSKSVPAPRPRLRDKDDDDDDDDITRPASRPNSNRTLVIVMASVGGVLLLAIIGVLIALFMPGPNGRSPAPVAAAPQPVVRPPDQAIQNPVQPPLVQPDPIKGNPLNQPIRPDPALPKEPPPPPPPPPVVAWQATVDPPAQAAREPADAKTPIPALNSVKVLFADRGGLFVSIGSNNTPRDVREIWNLESMQKVGTINGKLGVIDPILLSPDGKYLAGRALGNGTAIDIFSTANGQPVQRIQVDPQVVPLVVTDFAGPDQLVTVQNSVQAKRIQVWDLKTGMSVKQINLTAVPFDAKAFAVSPGGRYLALLDNGILTIYDLTNGSKAGESRVPMAPGAFPSSPKALAFSPDGAELAALLDIPDPQIVVWDMAKGEVTKNLKPPKDIRSLEKQALIYLGNALEWVPDRSGWLLYGFILVDGASGKPVWTVPSNLEIGFPGPRRLLSPKHLAMTTGNGKTRKVQILELPREQIDAAVKAAATGQSPATAQGPPVTSTNWTGVKVLAQTDGLVPWNVETDPLPAKKLVTQPIPLKCKGADITQILFAGAAGQAAVISRVAPIDPLRPHTIHADRYDLATGQGLGGMDLFGVTKQGLLDFTGDLSPDGSCLAMIEPQDQKRVDVWSLANGKHLVGFLPLKNANALLRWVTLLDDKRLLTLSKAGRLTLWSIPDCKAIYTGEGFRGGLALSPGRKSLVVSRGSAIVVYDTATGEARGQLALPGGALPEQGFGMAFRRDGKALAGVIGTQGAGSQLVRWDLANGKVSDSLPYLIPSRNVQWCDDNHLMADSNLVDFNLKAAICTCVQTGIGRISLGGPDDRVWFAVSRGVTPAELSAQTLPDAATKQLAALLAKPETQALLRPGMGVSVRVALNGGGVKAEEIRQRAVDSLTNRLKAGGFNVADGQPLTLQVQMQEAATGKTTRYDPIGGRGAPTIVQIKQVNCQATLSGPAGMIWQDKAMFQTPDRLTVRGDNIQLTLDEQMWGLASSWGGGLNLPAYLVRIGGTVERLPRMVQLTGDR